MQNKQILLGAVAAFLVFEIVLAMNGGKWGGKTPEAPPVAAEPPPPTTVSATPVPAAVSAVSVESAPSTTTATEPPQTTPVAASATPGEVAPTAAGTAPSATTEELIGETLNGWAQAWAERNEAVYFGFYADDFVPPFGDDRKQWETIRSTRLKNSKPIKIALSKPVILMIDANHATVTFIQEFHSGSIKETNPKALLLVNKGGRWQIKEERVVN